MKVYVVTSSRCLVEKVFLDQYEAEKYCAINSDRHDKPVIETYDTDNNEKIECNRVYKAFEFSFDISIGKIRVSTDLSAVLYSDRPIAKDTYFHKGYYFGIIPFEGEIDAEKFKKIVMDEIAKYKATQPGL